MPGLSGGRGGLPPGPLRGASRLVRPIGGGGGGAPDDLTLPPPTLRPEGGVGGRGPMEVRRKKGSENFLHSFKCRFFNISLKPDHLCVLMTGSSQEMAAFR